MRRFKILLPLLEALQHKSLLLFLSKKVIGIAVSLCCIENYIHNSQPPTVTYLHHITHLDKKQVFFAQEHTFVNDIFPKRRFSLDKYFYFM